MKIRPLLSLICSTMLAQLAIGEARTVVDSSNIANMPEVKSLLEAVGWSIEFVRVTNSIATEYVTDSDAWSYWFDADGSIKKEYIGANSVLYKRNVAEDDDILLKVLDGDPERLTVTQVKPSGYPDCDWYTGNGWLGSYTIFACSTKYGTAKMYPYNPKAGATLRTSFGTLSGEYDGTWRRSLSTNAIDLVRDVDLADTYTYREGQSDSCTLPKAFQLYRLDAPSNSTDTDMLLPCNTNFFSRAIADKLLCQSITRAENYSTCTYIAVAPHYVIRCHHYAQNEPIMRSGIPWCVNRDTNEVMFNGIFATNTVAELTEQNYDIDVIRVQNAFPEHMIMEFCRASELRKASPTMLNGTIGFQRGRENCVVPCQIRVSQTFSGNATNISVQVDNVSKDYLKDEAYSPAITNIALNVKYANKQGSSGHPVFAVAPDGRVVFLGLKYNTDGSLRSLIDDGLIDAIKASIEADSNGAETAREMSLEAHTFELTGRKVGGKIIGGYTGYVRNE